MKMPVFGIYRDHKIGTYLLRPSSEVDPNSNHAQQRKTSKKTDYEPSVWKRGCRLARSSARSVTSDPNVLIAAYGTQVTLYRDTNGNDTSKKWTRAKSATPNNLSPIDVHVPTDSTANISHQSPNRLFNKARGTKTKGHSTGSSRLSRRPFSTVTFAYTSNDFRRTLVSENEFALEGNKNINMDGKTDKKSFLQGTQRTAWNTSDHNTSSDFISLANCVDFLEVKEEISKSCCPELRAPPATPDIDEIHFEGLPEPEPFCRESSTFSVAVDHSKEENKSSVPGTDRGSGTTCIDNEFDLDMQRNEDLSQYLNSRNIFQRSNGDNHDKLVSQLQAFGFNKAPVTRKPSRIEEVWGSRDRNSVSTRLEFSHMTLCRPRSALEFAKKSTVKEDSGILDCVKGKSANPSLQRTHCDDLNAPKVVTQKGNISKKRRKIQKRKKPSKTSNAKLEIRTASASEETSGGSFIDSKSLIRQNHRPTTAIRYCEQDHGTMPSITPCLRKATVSHAAYVTMHNHNPHYAADTKKSSQSIRSTSVSDMSNFSVTVIGVSNGNRSEKTISKSYPNHGDEQEGTDQQSDRKLSKNSFVSIDIPFGTQRSHSEQEIFKSSNVQKQTINTGDEDKWCIALKPSKCITAEDSRHAGNLESLQQEPGQKPSDELAVNEVNKNNNFVEERYTPLRLLLNQEQSENSTTDSRTGKNQDQPTKQIQTPALSQSLVHKLGGGSQMDNEVHDIFAKNRMIRKWLVKVENARTSPVAGLT